MKEFANYEMLFHTMLLHQVKTFLFLIYHHIYRASSSVHSFSSALSLRFVWSQGGNLCPLAASPCNCLGNLIMNLKNDGTQIQVERLHNFLSLSIYYSVNHSPGLLGAAL